MGDQLGDWDPARRRQQVLLLRRIVNGEEQSIGPFLAERLRAARARVETQIARLEQIRGRIDAFEATHGGALTGQPGAEIGGSPADRCASCT